MASREGMATASPAATHLGHMRGSCAYPTWRGAASRLLRCSGPGHVGAAPPVTTLGRSLMGASLAPCRGCRLVQRRLRGKRPPGCCWLHTHGGLDEETAFLEFDGDAENYMIIDLRLRLAARARSRLPL